MGIRVSVENVQARSILPRTTFSIVARGKGLSVRFIYYLSSESFILTKGWRMEVIFFLESPLR